MSQYLIILHAYSLFFQIYLDIKLSFL
uniref:Uncharacterized protein n=1 Tax=Arundo donax TaxID=35708 RepID=A0A0A9HIB4_ARUDO